MPTDSYPGTAMFDDADQREFLPGDLQLADTILRAVFYPTQELYALRGPEMNTVRKWPRYYTANLCAQFHLAARSMALDDLPQYVDTFVQQRFVNPRFLPFVAALTTLLLRYAAVEHESSCVSIRPVDERDQEQGFAIHSTIELSCGTHLSLVTAQIPWEASPPLQRWKSWAAVVPRFILGPLRFAAFTCCPPRECCRPNAKIVYSAGARPRAASLVTVRDIARGERIVVEWSDIHLLVSSSPLACISSSSANAEREREKARIRWAARLTQRAEARRKEARSPRVLVATEKIIGGALDPDSKTNWSKLHDALLEDLESWRGRRSPTDRDEYDTLTQELISCTGRAGRTSTRLIARIEKKQALLDKVSSVARTADDKRHEYNPRFHNEQFLRVYRQALTVMCALDDILFRYRDNVESFQTSYERRSLYWQSL
ncbi:hypothetical protein EXIGLDRAFT_779277 [Exidia glandulosa HHB12029]|uniref:SET domain-containing protein n=1 Tax=Exidia glandulosa HHB12029 TaxID=1314781 RepID=A0A165C509_EXIGL|nr:hypothetical protein EXIGLDRAFT_779277 [Exidia glandulosa HHB12029]